MFILSFIIVIICDLFEWNWICAVFAIFYWYVYCRWWSRWWNFINRFNTETFVPFL